MHDIISSFCFILEERNHSKMLNTICKLLDIADIDLDFKHIRNLF